MEIVKTILALDGQRARPVTQTWRDAPPPRFTMGVKTELEVRFMDRTGKPVDPLSECSDFKFALAEDFDAETPVVYSTQNVRRTGTGVFTIALENTRTAPMIHALGVSAYREMGCELVGMAGGETWDNPSACVQFPAVVRNRIDSGEVPEPDPGKTFITTDNLGQYALTRETLAAALSNVPDAVPGSLDGTIEKLEALVGALKTLA